jgi:hypothetical protein
MNRILLALILSLASFSSGAANWPWENSATEAPTEYCMGLIVGGLASDQVGGMSRAGLWQAWSYLIRSGALERPVASSDYQTGLEQFQNAPDAVAAESILQDAQGDCGLGRTGHQITGW